MLFASCSPTQNSTEPASSLNAVQSFVNVAKSVKNQAKTNSSLSASTSTKTELPTFPSDLPSSTKTQSNTLAIKLLTLCSQTENVSEIFDEIGLTLVKSSATKTVTHTATYSIAKGTVTYNANQRNLYVVVIYGTNGNEWYSNFDFAPSKNANSSFAENFLLAATDIYGSASSLWKDDTSPLFLVCGYGRGGAVANLLATLLNQDAQGGQDNVFAYTFGSPTTVKSDVATAENIFNYVCDADLVTKLPLNSFGFVRVGKDVVLSSTDSTALTLSKNFVSQIESTVSSVGDYYNGRYSLLSAGTSTDGITAYELATTLVSAVSQNGTQQTDIDLSMFDMVSQDSHYKQFFNFLSSLTKVEMLKLYNQHSADTYKTLTSKL